MWTFVFEGQNHTTGNLVADQVLDFNEPADLFASYLVPHPLSTQMHINMGTGTRAEATALLRSACEAVEKTLDGLLQQVDCPVERKPAIPPKGCCSVSVRQNQAT